LNAIVPRLRSWKASMTGPEPIGGRRPRRSLVPWVVFASAAVAAADSLAIDTPMGDVLCTIITWVIYGNLGRGLAVIAVLIVGVGATLGKVSWGLAITVGVGIAVIFGAPGIVTALGVPVTGACP
jgi:type IV secretion system protein VirB2